MPLLGLLHRRLKCLKTSLGLFRRFPPDIIFRIVEIMVVSNMKRTAFRFMLCKKAYKEPIARILFRSISFLHFIKSPHWIRYSENPTFVRRLQVAYADFAKYPFLGGELMRRASPRLESLTLDFQREKLERTECLLDQLDGMIGLKHLVLDDVQQELLGSITILPATLTHVSLNMYWPYNVQPQIPAAFLAQLESLPALQSLSILPMNPNAYHIFAGLPPKLRPLLRTIGCDVKAFSTLTADEEFASLEIVQLSAQGATEAEVSKMFLTLAGKAPRLTKFEMVGAPCSAILTAWKTFPLLKNLTISLVGHEKVNENKDPLLHHTHFSDYENSIRSLLDERSTVVKITLGFTETDPDARKRKECRFWKRMRTGFPNQVKLAGYA